MRIKSLARRRKKIITLLKAKKKKTCHDVGRHFLVSMFKYKNHFEKDCVYDEGSWERDQKHSMKNANPPSSKKLLFIPFWLERLTYTSKCALNPCLMPHRSREMKGNFFYKFYKGLQKESFSLSWIVDFYFE